ncbi:uncharacterized protein CLUP02_08847 [Colletotrichum lupini]|uniref:Uncharacterized protein n=1 Tax=Colletotrichum lupini TaxID=145971 RepID=A0A9Q8STM2_9PEZI|nr:uncharacterized protein CLUP02_08847 [Colletotrichum lupini]UQC83352.1 hypothetical protein CLUP02_08847 [Colletotrichum lupini]
MSCFDFSYLALSGLTVASLPHFLPPNLKVIVAGLSLTIARSWHCKEPGNDLRRHPKDARPRLTKRIILVYLFLAANGRRVKVHNVRLRLRGPLITVCSAWLLTCIYPKPSPHRRIRSYPSPSIQLSVAFYLTLPCLTVTYLEAAKEKKSPQPIGSNSLQSILHLHHIPHPIGIAIAACSLPRHAHFCSQQNLSPVTPPCQPLAHLLALTNQKRSSPSIGHWRSANQRQCDAQASRRGAACLGHYSTILDQDSVLITLLRQNVTIACISSSISTSRPAPFRFASRTNPRCLADILVLFIDDPWQSPVFDPTTPRSYGQITNHVLQPKLETSPLSNQRSNYKPRRSRCHFSYPRSLACYPTQHRSASRLVSMDNSPPYTIAIDLIDTNLYAPLPGIFPKKINNSYIILRIEDKEHNCSLRPEIFLTFHNTFKALRYIRSKCDPTPRANAKVTIGVMHCRENTTVTPPICIRSFSQRTHAKVYHHLTLSTQPTSEAPLAAASALVLDVTHEDHATETRKYTPKGKSKFARQIDNTPFTVYAPIGELSTCLRSQIAGSQDGSYVSPSSTANCNTYKHSNTKPERLCWTSQITSVVEGDTAKFTMNGTRSTKGTTSASPRPIKLEKSHAYPGGDIARDSGDSSNPTCHGGSSAPRPAAHMYLPRVVGASRDTDLASRPKADRLIFNGLLLTLDCTEPLRLHPR